MLKTVATSLAFTLILLISVFLTSNHIIVPAIIRGAISTFLLFLAIFWLINFIKINLLRIALSLLVAVVFSLVSTHVTLNSSYPDANFAHLGNNNIFYQALLKEPTFYYWLLAYICGLCVQTINPHLDLRIRPFLVGFCTLVPLLFLVITTIFPVPVFSNWYAQNVLEYNLQNKRTSTQVNAVINGQTLIDSRYRDNDKDINASKVILLLVEGLSQVHVDAGWAPNLRKLEANGLKLNTFVNHQRQTNRGLYAALCGAYPNLQTSVSKSDLMALSGLKQNCLPGYLENNGIHTAFLQSAKLNYMSKDLFADSAGFSEVKGESELKKSQTTGPWGLDDWSLLDQLLFYLESNKEDKLFVTALTSGTHPPFQTPNGDQGKEEAFRYADKAINWFITNLDEKGLLNDTVILITSDESAPGGLASSSFLPANNTGYMLAIGKNVAAEVKAGLFGQVDIPATVSEIFGLKWGNSGIPITKTPAEDRILYAGNTFQRTVYEISSNQSHQCNNYTLCKGSEVSRRVTNIIERNDLSSNAFSQYIALMEERSFNTMRDELIIGRLITNVEQGQSLVASFNIQTSTASTSQEEKVLTFLAWDCSESIPTSIRHQVKIPGSKGSKKFNLITPQVFENQCYKIWVNDGQGAIDPNWQLKKFAMYLHPEEKKYIESLSAENRTRRRLPRVAHAGGEIEGKSYTNSLAALDRNYGLGFRYFEIDFIWTSDNRLVCGHDWDKHLFINSGIIFKSAPSYETFMREVRSKSNPPCTVQELIKWFADKKDAILITDIKSNNLLGLSKLAELTDNPSFILPQIYSPKEYHDVLALGFPNVILTLYRYPGSSTELLRELAGKNVFAVTMPKRKARTGLASLLSNLGVGTYVHTINNPDTHKEFRDTWKVTEIYTDSITPNLGTFPSDSYN